MHLAVRQHRAVPDNAPLPKNALGELAALADNHTVHEHTLRELCAFQNLATRPNHRLLDGRLLFHRHILADQAVLLRNGGSRLDTFRIRDFPGMRER